MRMFWKINSYVGLLGFVLFLIGAISEFFFRPILSLFFIYGPFLELTQLPICMVALLAEYRPRRLGLYFFAMTCSLVIKIVVLLILFGSRFS